MKECGWFNILALTVEAMCMQQGDEKIWIQAINRKEKEGFSRLYRHYYQALCAYANNFMTDFHISEELVQDLFLKLWEKDLAFEDLVHVRSYLYKSLANACRNALESRKVREMHAPRIASLYEEAFHNDFLEREEEKITLLRAIATLPEQCRKVFELSRFEELKHREIATQLDISERTVEKHIGVALKKLKALLGGR